ncbi:MAG: hypothetical protein EHM31_12690 [Candidatus Aminicenantes bacterium]|nr:MAG: hypothetical protein EHM31_12690 [Candidatus Aminicenantes bacterium]
MTIRSLLKRRRAFQPALAAAVLALIPALAAGQEAQTTEITRVTDLYKLENLLPEMSSGEIGTIKDLAAWCLDMSKYFRDRLAESRKQVDLQRETKRAEIKALEARVKSAGRAKDEASKKALAAEVKVQKAELEVLDAVKEIADQEGAAAGDFEAAGKSLRDLSGAFQDLSDNRSDAQRTYERAREEAAAAGLAVPQLVIGYPANDKAMKSVNDAGKYVKDLGDRLQKVSKARQSLVGAWEKLEKARTEKDALPRRP